MFITEFSWWALARTMPKFSTAARRMLSPLRYKNLWIIRASRNKEVSHRHAHLHLKMVGEFSKLPFDVVTQMMEKEAGHYSVITVGHFYSIIHRKLR